jgi:hypothetical protein
VHRHFRYRKEAQIIAEQDPCRAEGTVTVACKAADPDRMQACVLRQLGDGGLKIHVLVSNVVGDDAARPQVMTKKFEGLHSKQVQRDGVA